MRKRAPKKLKPMCTAVQRFRKNTMSTERIYLIRQIAE